MEKYTESHVDEFLGKLPIRKDLNSIRAKNILMEDILDLLLFDGRSEFECDAGWYPDGLFGYHETYYTGIYWTPTKVIELRFVWCAARLGIPSLIVSVKSKEDWILFRQELRDRKLVR